MIRVTIVGLLSALLISFIYIARNDLPFYYNLFRADRAGRQFYRTYPHIARDVAFDPAMTVRMDVYSPADGEDHPILLFIHGGGWDSYNKELFAPVAQKLIGHGMVVAIPDYTLHPDGDYGQMAAEMAAAAAWLLENGERYGGDPGRLVVTGHSAGGHLGGLIYTDERWLAANNHHPQELCGFIGLSGVYDIDAQMMFERGKGSNAPVMTAVMGGEANFPMASPITYIAAPRKPVTLIHGDQDSTVPLSISLAFAQALDDAEVPVEMLVYAGAGHTDFLFKALSDDNAPVIADIRNAVHRCQARS